MEVKRVVLFGYIMWIVACTQPDPLVHSKQETPTYGQASVVEEIDKPQLQTYLSACEFLTAGEAKTFLACQTAISAQAATNSCRYFCDNPFGAIVLSLAEVDIRASSAIRDSRDEKETLVPVEIAGADFAHLEADDGRITFQRGKLSFTLSLPGGQREHIIALAEQITSKMNQNPQ